MAQVQSKKLVLQFDVEMGNCKLEFYAPTGTGRNPDCLPGVGFRLESPSPAHLVNGKYHHGMGVISRSNAFLLRDMLDEFLAEHPPAHQ